MVKTAVIGHGSFGKKRIEAVKKVGQLSGYKEAEAVIICTPPKYHFEATIAALNDGKHVLCEKPLATTSKQAIEMVRVAKKNNKFLKVGSNHRFFKQIMEVKDRKVKTFFGEIGHNRKLPEWYYDKEVSGGGTLIDNGWHLIDLVKMFMGDIKYDDSLLIGNPETTAELWLNNRNAYIYSSWKKEDEYIWIYLRTNKGVVEITDDPERGSQERELEYFYKCIKNGVQPEPSGEDGIEILKIIEKAYAKTKKWSS